MQEVVLATPPVAQVPPGRAMPPRVALRAVPGTLPVVQATRPVMLVVVPAAPGTAAQRVLATAGPAQVMLQEMLRVVLVAPAVAALAVMRRPLPRLAAPVRVVPRAAVMRPAGMVVLVVPRPRVMVARVRAVLEVRVRAVTQPAEQVAPVVP